MPHNKKKSYKWEDVEDLSNEFQSVSLHSKGGHKAYSGLQFPEYAEEFSRRVPASIRRLSAPSEGPCACVSNRAVRERLGVVGDPSADIDHIVEAHRVHMRGWNPDIEVNKELAPSSLNRRWGQLYRYGRYDEVEAEKRAYYGDERYEEAVRGVEHCNNKYRYN